MKKFALGLLVLAMSQATLAANSTTATHQVRVQMGAYQNQAGAQQQVASAALLGVRAQIQQITTAQGAVMYRVRSEPMTRAQAETAIKRLQQEKIEAFITNQ